MNFDQHMNLFESDLDKKYPHHVKVGDKVEMLAEREQASGAWWEIRDTGTVMYVGPGYAIVEFWKNRDYDGVINLRLNAVSGMIDQLQRVYGFKFRGPVRLVPINELVEENSH